VLANNSIALALREQVYIMHVDDLTRFSAHIRPCESPSNAQYNNHTPTAANHVRRPNQHISDKSSAVAEMGDRGHNRHGPKIWGLRPLFGEGGAGSPSNTIWPWSWPWPRPTCMPSFILIHPTIRPQYTNVTDRQTDRQDRQADNGPIA